MADSPVVEFVKKEETWRLVEHAIVALSAAYGAKKLFGGKGFVANVSGFIVSAVKVMPGGQALIDKEQGAIIEVIKKEVTEAEKNMDNRFGDLTAIPEEGFSSDDILDVLKQWRSCEKGYRSGKQFGGIYTDDKELKSTISAAFTMFADSNGLYPTIFPALRKMEMEVVKMTANLLHGTPGKTCGVMTTGGTESIIMSILAHKKWAKATKGIVSPEAVVPVSAHAAFAKGCAYFDVKLVTVPLDENCRVDVNAVKKAINSNTIMLVGSAPTFPQGVIDPIEELAAIAKKNNIGMHVDSCLGGFLLPFLVKLGHLKKKFDFAVDGVTAMSADIHKFGYGPKQSSVILYASRELRKFQFFSYSDWTGGVYASPSLCGSRAGGTIAASWTTLVRLGNKGYLEKVSMCWNVMQQLVNGINAIDGLTVLGPPEASCVSFKSAGRLPKPNDVFKVADAMGERGWFFPRLQNPICCLVQVGAKSTFDAEQFLKDLESCVEEVVAEPLKYGEGMAKVYGMAATVPDRSVVDDLLKSYIDTIYS